jgi:hypothetical protein
MQGKRAIAFMSKGLTIHCNTKGYVNGVGLYNLIQERKRKQGCG